ncbi:MAG: AIR synthase-related protein, partial [Gammaproteobacteria bacterium]
DLGTWKRPPVFDWLRSTSGLGDTELYKTFNCGVGMVICVPPHAAPEAIAMLEAGGEQAFEIGVVAASDAEAQVRLRGGEGS